MQEGGFSWGRLSCFKFKNNYICHRATEATIQGSTLKLFGRNLICSVDGVDEANKLPSPLINNMTRTELRDKMLQSGDIHRPDKHNPFWVQAFEMYKSETKDYEVSTGCGSCFRKVGAWLRK